MSVMNDLQGPVPFFAIDLGVTWPNHEFTGWTRKDFKYYIDKIRQEIDNIDTNLNDPEEEVDLAFSKIHAVTLGSYVMMLHYIIKKKEWGG